MVRDDIIINDDNILVDILYCPQGNLGEVDAFNWVNYYEKELIQELRREENGGEFYGFWDDHEDSPHKGASIKNFSEVKVKTTYAPIAVVSGVPEDYESFVELDYFQNNCINILNKGNGMGLAGGISLSDKKMADEYLDKVFKAHKKLEPKLIEVSRYTGIKSEITFKNEPRGYLYHIVRTGDDIWALIPGKFTLSFSMAPEFYRRVYNKNPRKYLSTIKSNIESKKIVSNTVWMDKLKKIEGKNGIN